MITQSLKTFPIVFVLGASMKGLKPVPPLSPEPLICTPRPAISYSSGAPRRSMLICGQKAFVPINPRAPEPPFEDAILRAAQATGLDPLLIRAVIVAESQFHAREISPAGACGLMQLMPRTARLFGVKDIFDPEENVLAGAKHLRYLMRRFSNNLPLTLAAYNAGEVPVLRHKGIPPYPETQHYVRHVLRLYSNFRNT